MDIGEKIKTLRIAKGLTQEELGTMIGVKKAAIQKYEKGTVENLKRSTIVSLANILGSTPCELMGWSEYEKESNLSAKEKTLLDNYNKLNDLGKDEAIKRVSELTEIYKYTKEETCCTIKEDKSYLEVFAAHDREGEFSEEDIQHDLDIMNDENF